jgi:hypothetical protein
MPHINQIQVWQARSLSNLFNSSLPDFPLFLEFRVGKLAGLKKLHALDKLLQAIFVHLEKNESGIDNKGK